MTIGEAAAYARRKLGEKDSAHEAWLLMEFVTGVRLEKLIAERDSLLSEQAEEALAGLIAGRLSGVPLQQLLGKWEFMGLELFVDRDVLVPRQDTETLAEAALEWSKANKAKTALDLCTGSGCIGIALAKLGGLNVTATDLSESALRLAVKNAVKNGVKLNVQKSDMFRDVKGMFDIIVSNPPYIPSGDIQSLMPEVRDHEPRMALDGGKDGMDFYKIIAANAPSRLKPGGALLVEVGAGQAEGVKKLFESAGLSNARVYKDASGTDRVVSAEKSGRSTGTRRK